MTGRGDSRATRKGRCRGGSAIRVLLPLCRDPKKSLAHLSGSLSLVHHSACHLEQVEVSSHLPSEGPASVLVSVLYSTLHALRARLASKGNCNHTCLNTFRYSQVHSYALTASSPSCSRHLGSFSLSCPKPNAGQLSFLSPSLSIPPFLLPPSLYLTRSKVPSMPQFGVLLRSEVQRGCPRRICAHTHTLSAPGPGGCDSPPTRGSWPGRATTACSRAARRGRSSDVGCGRRCGRAPTRRGRPRRAGEAAGRDSMNAGTTGSLTPPSPAAQHTDLPAAGDRHVQAPV